MTKIQIYGTGCAKCNKLQQHAEEAAKNIGIDFEIEKVDDMNDIMAAGIMMTPGLGIDGKVVSTGRLLNVKQIEDILNN